ncbi:hypothetical protein [Halobacillus litoralis]|uniref:hypothetical protein n=1 Tax=Halobacillus litoralis TaxID=45668 RepID=UPI00136F1279|nr:hypothetical protein [Halobacillus litoralis]MYL39835.1 hypothetical protein [Halobacillus litoralis]
MKEKETARYEFGVIKEYGDQEVIVLVNGMEYHVLLSEEEAETVETLLLEENFEYVAFDTEAEKVVFEDVFNMTELDEEALADIHEGVNDDGVAE